MIRTTKHVVREGPSWGRLRARRMNDVDDELHFQERQQEREGNRVIPGLLSPIPTNYNGKISLDLSSSSG